CPPVDQYDGRELLDQIVQHEVVHAGGHQNQRIALLPGLPRDRGFPLRRWRFSHQHAVSLCLGRPGKAAQDRLEHRIAEVRHDEGDGESTAGGKIPGCEVGPIVQALSYFSYPRPDLRVHCRAPVEYPGDRGTGNAGSLGHLGDSGARASSWHQLSCPSHRTVTGPKLACRSCSDGGARLSPVAKRPTSAPIQCPFVAGQSVSNAVYVDGVSSAFWPSPAWFWPASASLHPAAACGGCGSEAPSVTCPAVSTSSWRRTDTSLVGSLLSSLAVCPDSSASSLPITACTRATPSASRRSPAQA